MAIAEFHFSSDNSLGRQISATLIVPEKMPGPFPVLYLLHGHSDDHTAWTRYSNVELYVRELPLIVVMPDTERGWYVDAKHDPSKKFESMIVKDLVPFVDGAFHTVRSRGGRAIAGLSMGGYGALHLAASHPDMFCAAHGLSSAFGHGGTRPENEEARLIFGDEPAGGEYDLHAVLSKMDKANSPQFTFDCGVDDFTLDSNRELNQLLTKLGIAHTYTEYPGSHSWIYWNEHILTALPGILSALNISKRFDPADFLPNVSQPISTSG